MREVNFTLRTSLSRKQIHKIGVSTRRGLTCAKLQNIIKWWNLYCVPIQVLTKQCFYLTNEWQWLSTQNFSGVQCGPKINRIIENDDGIRNKVYLKQSTNGEGKNYPKYQMYTSLFSPFSEPADTRPLLYWYHDVYYLY